MFQMLHQEGLSASLVGRSGTCPTLGAAAWTNINPGAQGSHESVAQLPALWAAVGWAESGTGASAKDGGGKAAAPKETHDSRGPEPGLWGSCRLSSGLHPFLVAL